MNKPILLGLVLAVSLAACAPRTEAPEPSATPSRALPEPTETPGAPEAPAGETITLTDPVALEADRAAREAFHLMGLYYLEMGRYSAEVLLSELDLPTGVQWAVQEISDTSYALQIVSDNVPGVAWAVTPEGVTARQVEDNQIY